MTAKSPIKYPGGKTYLAPHIVQLMELYPHTSYIEAYCGGCSVLFARDPDYNWSHQPKNVGCSEIINDLSGDLVNFWEVVASPLGFYQLRHALNLLPFAKDSFDRAVFTLDCEPGNPVSRAVAYFIRNRQSRSGNGKSFITPVMNRTRRGINDHVSAYLSAIDGLPEAHARLRTVLVEHQPAVDLISKHMANPNVLIYLDPPYLHSTRATKDLYEWEMTQDDHERLLDTILKATCGVLLSGYRNDLYDAKLSTWTRKDITTKKHMSGSKKKADATESLWYNYG